MTNAIEKVVIVGGGTAGWMTALSLAKYAQINPMQITLVQSDDIETVGVGEATIPNFVQFNRNLGIDEQTLLSETNATFKLGIKFQDWAQTGHAFFHPFADYGVNMNNADFHHYLLRAKAEGLSPEIGQYSLATQLAHVGKFSIIDEPQNVLDDYGYAYHFDAGLYATLLKKIAIKQGVKHKTATIEAVQCRVDGFIQHLVTNHGEVIEGDLFIDCTGFRGRLIEQTLQTGYETWEQWLLCDKAIAVQSEIIGEPNPYTTSTAEHNGWRWSIPLQNRMGNGYLYASQWQSDESATAQLLDCLDGAAITSPRKIPFTPGRRKKIWNKNCFAIGLSSGFIEPLESTSISLIQSAIAKLLTYFPDKSFDSVLADQVNRLHNTEVERVRDFIILHYKLSRRSESEFWRYCANMAIPDTLHEKIELYRATAMVDQRECESFEQSSWLSMFFGFDVHPKRFDPRVKQMPLNALIHNLQQMHGYIERRMVKIPTHSDYISSVLGRV